MELQQLGSAVDGVLEAKACFEALSQETRRLGSSAMADYYARKAEGLARGLEILRSQWREALKQELASLDAAKQ